MARWWEYFLAKNAMMVSGCQWYTKVNITWGCAPCQTLLGILNTNLFVWWLLLEVIPPSNGHVQMIISPRDCLEQGMFWALNCILYVLLACFFSRMNEPFVFSWKPILHMFVALVWTVKYPVKAVGLWVFEDTLLSWCFLSTVECMFRIYFWMENCTTTTYYYLYLNVFNMCQLYPVTTPEILVNIAVMFVINIFQWFSMSVRKRAGS